MNDDEKFYVTFRLKDGVLTGHRISSEMPKLDEDVALESKENAKEVTDEKPNQSEFGKNLRSIEDNFNIYADFVPSILNIAPTLARETAGRRLHKFVSRQGVKMEAQSDDRNEVFQMEFEHYAGAVRLHDRSAASLVGLSYLPQFMIIGLISSYDFFLANLIRIVLRHENKIVFSSEKSLTYEEMFKFDTMEDAKNSAIEKEVENVLRKSHAQQFDWMETKFGLELRKGLDVWSKFIEVCERRNLFTHTGGVVSEQYLKVCAEHGHACGSLKAGDKIDVNPNYYTASVYAVYEVLLKLNYVLWHKFDKKTKADADVDINECCYELTQKGAYALAENVLSFTSGVMKTFKGSERTRRMMIINYANAVRLRNRQEAAKKIIAKEDWSATSLDFQICASAVEGSVERVCDLMREIGSSGPVGKEHYRTWPVFRKIRTQAAFMRTFHDVFGQPVMVKKEDNIADENGTNIIH